MIISYDKNKKLRAKLNGKSYVIKHVNNKYVLKIDEKTKSVTSHVTRFLSQNGGDLSCLPSEIIQEIAKKLDVKSLLSFMETQRDINKAIDAIIAKPNQPNENLENLKALKKQSEDAFASMFSSGQGGEEIYDNLLSDLRTKLALPL